MCDKISLVLFVQQFCRSEYFVAIQTDRAGIASRQRHGVERTMNEIDQHGQSHTLLAHTTTATTTLETDGVN